MKLIQVIRELLAGLDAAKVQQFITLLLMIFGSGGPRGAKADTEAPTPAEKEQLKDELIARGCSPEDCDKIVENL
jgi:hypothetical protein